MYKKHLAVALMAFLICSISIYFGVRIYNANENIHLTELNAFDKIYYDHVSLVPALSMMASLITLPFLLGIVILQVIIIIKAKKKSIKNIAIGLLIAATLILCIDGLTLYDPEYFDFSKWGFVWICLGLIIVAGSLLSYAIHKFKPEASSASN
jgi:hypothetical protein